jgi:hypothetical protein
MVERREYGRTPKSGGKVDGWRVEAAVQRINVGVN